MHLSPRVQGRLLIVSASVLWSLSGLFVRLLRHPSSGSWAEPPVPPLLIAFYRCLFASLALAPALRLGDIRWHPLLIAMTISFATMNALFVSALSLGSAANAIILQYTAPFWLYVAAAVFLGERPSQREILALTLALSGVGVIVASGLSNLYLDPSSLVATIVALGSGLAYAGVVFCLRLLRDYSSFWLTWLNHAAAALTLLPVLSFYQQPHLAQLIILFAFGTIQMAIPYWLVSRGLKTVPSQEAGMLTLVEPLLNPLWVYLFFHEIPEQPTIWGGALIFLALVWQFWPVSSKATPPAQTNLDSAAPANEARNPPENLT
ncbi:MAG: DMT family transporter [Gemmatales bacterium]|nr:DMT family transporter [Gemmatales bacterium]